MTSQSSTLRADMARRNWTRNELILAFNLYCKIPFGQIDHRNRQVVQLASAIGRTPCALAWKLANFARLDRALRQRGIKGAGHGSAAEDEIWNEFHANWDALAFESERLLSEVIPILSLSADSDEVATFPEGRTREALAKVRVNQTFFRAAVLAAYDEKCCISGISFRQLLVASHIIPWSKDVSNRTNPRNGLCLSSIHDRAFDAGLITITPELRVRISPSLRRAAKQQSVQDFFFRYEGSTISLPSRFIPNREFLEYHNKVIFLSKS